MGDGVWSGLMGLGVSLGQRCGPRGDDEWCLVNPVPGESELMSSSITTAQGVGKVGGWLSDL